MKPIVTKRQREERARRKAMGVAVIERPLRLIASKTNEVVRDDKGNVKVIPSREFKLAQACASQGDGRIVKAIARDVLRG